MRFRVLTKWTRSQPIRTAGQIALTFSLLEARPAFAYQRIAVEATRLQNLGMSAVTIAKSLGVTDKTVVKAISWVRLTTVSAHSDTKSLGERTGYQPEPRFGRIRRNEPE